RVDAEVVQELDRDDTDFECVSGLSAVDVDWPGHRMCARTALGHPLLDQLQRLGDLSLGGAGETQPLQSTRDHRLDPDAIAGRDVKNGRESGIVIAPVHV